MEFLTIILSISAILSILLAIAIGVKNGVKSIFISAILYILAIDFISVIKNDSNAFNFFWIKFPLLIPNMLLGAFALVHTKIQLSNKLKFKDYYLFCIITLILLLVYLLVNRVDKSSQIYLVLKSSINFCFVIISFIILHFRMDRKEQVSKNEIIDLKKNKNFLIALFVIIIADIANMCFSMNASSNSSNIYFYSASLFAIIFLGYNELFSRRVKQGSSESETEEDYHDSTEGIDETEFEGLQENRISENRIILSDESVLEIATKIKEYLDKNKEFQRNPDAKVKQLAAEINVKYPELSYVLKVHFELTFNNFINSLRIEEAKELIKNNDKTNYKMDVIGEIVGFKTKNSFYLAFKKFTNTNPSKYKKSNI